MKHILFILIAIAGALTGCDAVVTSQYVYPEFIQKATDFCEPNDGVEKLVITSSRRPGHINAGTWGYVHCNNTARFDFHVMVVRKENT